MSLSLALITRNVAGDAIVDLIDFGNTVSNGYIEIRTGVKPGSPQNSATGILLAVLEFSNPAFTDFVNGASSANDIANEDEVINSGQASWFRIYNRDQGGVLDGEITPIGQGGDITFDNVDFIKGGVVTIAAINAVMPE